MILPNQEEYYRKKHSKLDICKHCKRAEIKDHAKQFFKYISPIFWLGFGFGAVAGVFFTLWYLINFMGVII